MVVALQPIFLLPVGESAARIPTDASRGPNGSRALVWVMNGCSGARSATTTCDVTLRMVDFLLDHARGLI